MKRITAYLKDKVANIKAENREKRIYAAIETAKINKEGDIADAEVGIESHRGTCKHGQRGRDYTAHIRLHG